MSTYFHSDLLVGVFNCIHEALHSSYMCMLYWLSHWYPGVRANLQAWLEKLECGGDVEKQAYFKKKFIQRLRDSPVAIDTDKANEQHYEVPTEFFLTVSQHCYNICIMHSSANIQSPPCLLSVHFFCLCDMVYHTQEVCFLLCLLGLIVTWQS